ncbi:MAG: permease-like cell division protein FtsX [Bacteroidota bacterium]
MRARTFGYFLREAGKGLSRNSLMALAAATTITISLLIMGVFMVLITNLKHLGERAKAEIQLRVILADEVSPEQGMALRAEIATYQEDGVRRVRFVSKQEGAREVERTWGLPELFAGLEENPLPDMLVVELRRGARVDKLVRQINGLPGVEEIIYRDFIRTVLLVVQILWVAGLALILAVSLGVLYIVVNTIRLTVFARRREIEIMKLVGATDWFVRWPFVLEGLILGLSGAILATILLSKGYYFLLKSFRHLSVVPLVAEPQINHLLLLILFPAGIFFGVFGSLLSVKKFLRD